MSSSAVLSPGGERMQFVCQYCYSPVMLGKPPSIDTPTSKQSPMASSPPSKATSKSSSALSYASSIAGGKKHSRGGHANLPSTISTGANNVKASYEEIVYKGPEESFAAFQKVLHELEQENRGKVNPRMRVASINPLVLTAIQSYSDFDESLTSNKSDYEHDSTLNIQTDLNTNDTVNEHQPSSDCQGGTQDESEDDRSFEHSELFGESRGIVSRGSILPTERQLADNENLLPYSKETADAVFDSLSDCSAVDFPLCCACADVLVDGLNKKAGLLQEECRSLHDLKNVQEAKLKELCDESELDELIAQLESEEQRLLTDLEDLENEKKHLEATSKKLDEEEANMLKEESTLSIENNRLQSEIHELETALKSYSEQLKFSEDHFNALKKTNIFNLVFNIWHYDHKFGTINGFRLGRLNDATSGPRVEWSEINMALGQACLLLHCLVDKLNFQPNVYTLVPCGSRSYIEAEIPSGSGVTREKLHLYSEGGNKFFYDSSIDNAMKAFLNVLEQFRATLEQKNSEFCLPYPMRGEFIYEKQGSDIGFSVCPGRTSSEVWTKACRMLLTNLKWGIVGVSTVAPHPSDWLQPQIPGEQGAFMPSNSSPRLGSTVSGVSRKGAYHYASTNS